jgi:hypothetical protein
MKPFMVDTQHINTHSGINSPTLKYFITTPTLNFQTSFGERDIIKSEGPQLKHV